jgi:hypothetical protein
MTLTEFLLARIAEDESVANKYPDLGGNYDHWELGFSFDRDYSEPMDIAIDPARVLAECEAKRRIIDAAVEVARVDLNEPVEPDDQGLRDSGVKILCALAVPYADHPDYLPEWRV